MSNFGREITNSQQIQCLENQLNLARREINNLRQQLRTLNHVHRKEIDEISKKLENWQCLECRNRQIDDATTENDTVTVKQIGVIRTNFPEKRGTPRQTGVVPEVSAMLKLNNEVFTNPNHALEGLVEFSHMWILFYFHKNDATHVRAKVAPPRLNGVRTGVFATRSPHRPSPIGLSLVKIGRIVDNTIYFSGVDMVDQTPVIDIKPYIPQYDNPGLANLLDNRMSLDEAAHGSNIQPADQLRDNINIRIMDGEENSRDHVIGAASTSVSRTTVEDYTNSRIGEREAPDGEEEETPPQPVNIASQEDIRVPSWIDEPSRLSVSFKDRALSQLIQLGPEGEEKKNIITNVLREDPRSVYLRERWGSHCYIFRIAELCVSCKFNDETHSVTVYQVFQNDAPECDD